MAPSHLSNQEYCLMLSGAVSAFREAKAVVAKAEIRHGVRIPDPYKAEFKLGWTLVSKSMGETEDIELAKEELRQAKNEFQKVLAVCLISCVVNRLTVLRPLAKKVKDKNLRTTLIAAHNGGLDRVPVALDHFSEEEYQESINVSRSVYQRAVGAIKYARGWMESTGRQPPKEKRASLNVVIKKLEQGSIEAKAFFAIGSLIAIVGILIGILY